MTSWLSIKKYFLIITVLLTVTLCYGQNESLSIRKVVDSLDLIKPLDNKRVKPKGTAYIIKINNQNKFDRINGYLNEAIKRGEKNIIVKIKKGIYYYSENHISRKNECTNAFISFEGDNAVLISNSTYNKRIDKDNPWSELVQPDSLIQIVDTINKLCRIPYKNATPENGDTHFTKIQITQWYNSRIYPLHHIDDNGIYFIAPELKYVQGFGRNGYSVNYDYLYLGQIPRFRLYDIASEKTYQASQFLSIQNSSYKGLVVKGICFRGNKEGGYVLSFKKVNAEQILVTSCMFDNLDGGILSVKGTDNCTFDNNLIQNTGGNELLFSDGSQNVRVTRNKFERCGQGLKQSFCIDCGEAVYYIAHNSFCDFGYSAIGVGKWHGHKKNRVSRGIIEYNEIYFTPNYFSYYLKYTLMDSGAIYTWTQNDGVIIRYNYIHDYTGAGHNRGIFCDDGASNIKIYGNLILNIPNSYSIDLRKVKDQNKTFENNANNFMAYNIIDTKVRFMGYDDERHNTKGQNYVIRGDSIPLKNVYENLENEEIDITILCNCATIDELKANKNARNILKTNPCYNKLKIFSNR